jgi:PAS domain S-box-containing protein
MGAIGFALTELDGRLRAVNQPFCIMLGYAAEELVGRPYSAFTHPEDHGIGLALVARLLAGEVDHNHIEKRYLHRDGHVVWGLLAGSLIRDDDAQPSYFLVQVTDISKQKEAEESLGRYAAELERSNTELETFAFVASHDLQGPLRTVASYSELLVERYGGRLDEIGRRWLWHITGGVDRMQGLIDDLLTLARLRTEGARFTPTDLGNLVPGSWDRHVRLQRGVDATLLLDTLPVVDGNPAQLEMLFDNLFSNAFKYRRTNVSLRVKVSARRSDDAVGPSWRIGVRDNGIGLDMNSATRIFEIFHRLHRGAEYAGTGIGLAICKRIVERHGGRIWVESSAGEGTTFLFKLPEHSLR